MTEVLFYHLERQRLEQVLPGLLEKTLARGWKAVVRCGSAEAARGLDETLWTYADESFLPHGLAADERYAARQPILLTEDEGLANEPDLLFLVSGAKADAASLSCFKRCVTVFDGGDDEAVLEARKFWKAVRDKGFDATYWRQSSAGKWEKQA